MPSPKPPLTAQEIKALPRETQTRLISFIDSYQLLVDENGALQRRIERQQNEIERLKQRLAQYEPDVLAEGTRHEDSGKGNDSQTAEKAATAFSVEAEE